MTPESMEVEITVTRRYKMDEALILSTPGFAPPAPDATAKEKRAWLRESFYELCGFQRDEDHIDGSYVSLTGEVVEAWFNWSDDLLDEG